MDNNWAAENLKTIRTLMERSAIYRRALAPVSTYVGTVGLAAAFIGWYVDIESTRAFTIFWLSVSLMALAGAFLLIRRQSMKDGEPFWSPPTRRVIQAMFPPLFIGLFIGVFQAWMIGAIDPRNNQSMWALVMCWAMLYGCALHSAGFFMPRGVKWFSWFFIAAGCSVLFGWIWIVDSTVWKFPPHWLMGIVFGASHLAYGIYLYFTEPRKNEA